MFFRARPRRPSFFFFSSRRRHTRSLCDWSSDVCSSDLGPRIANYLQSLEKRLDGRGVATPQKFLMQSNGGLMRISLGARHPNQTLLSGPAAGVIAGADLARARSEERRGGEGCRSGGEPR